MLHLTNFLSYSMFTLLLRKNLLLGSKRKAINIYFAFLRKVK